MKATKFVLVAALMSFVMMSFAQSESARNSNPFAVKISISKAMENPGLVKAMYRQIDEKTVLAGEPAGYITAQVSYGHVTHFIYGKYSEWLRFFVIDKMLTRKNVIQR